MPARRMLMVLGGIGSGEAAAQTVLCALSRAAHPYGVRFLVSDAFREAFAPIQAQLDALRPNAVIFGEVTGSPADALPYLTDETHFLFLTGAYGFAARWDATLWGALRAVKARDVLLTASVRPPEGTPPQPAKPDAPILRRRTPLCEDSPTRIVHKLTPSVPYVPAEAFLPALSEQFEANAVRLCYGLPLVCAARPVRTLVIDPALLMGPVAFLGLAPLPMDQLSFAAYLSGYTVYALPQAALWPLCELPTRVLTRPDPTAQAGSSLMRFEQLAGFRYDQRRAGVKTVWGLFGIEDTYPQRLPRDLLAAQHLQAARIQVGLRRAPLLVTAFIDLPAPRPVASYVLRFGFLKAIRALPLLLYTGGRQERMLRAGFPNTQSYPDNNLLPKSLLQNGMTPDEHFRRSKPLLLLRTAQRHPQLSHIAWVDADILPHPVCPDAVPDFSALLDDRIHLATVDGVPDAAFVVVPTKHISLLAATAKSLTLLDAELEHALSEAALWDKLIHKYPDLFTLHPMPRRRLLFFTVFDARLLGRRLRACLPIPTAHYIKERKRSSHVR